MKKFKKVFQENISLLSVLFIFSLFLLGPVETYAGSMAADYLVEIGRDFYSHNRIEDALHEFKKALLIEPNNQEALDYIRLLEKPKEIATLAPERIQEIPIQRRIEKKPIVRREQEIEELPLAVQKAAPIKEGYKESYIEEPVISPFPSDVSIREREIESAITELTLKEPEQEAPMELAAIPKDTQRKGGLLVYQLEKSEEQLKQEKAVEELTKKATAVPEKPLVIPESALPSVQLRGNAIYNYINYHVAPSFHSFLYSLVGRAYDFDLKYETNYRDINRRFDHDYTYLNLTKPGLSIGLFDQSIGLYPLRLQSDSFKGIKLIKDWEKLNTTFSAGETENSFSESSGSVKYKGAVYGLRESFSPSEWLDLGGALFYLQNEAETAALAGTTSYARKNIVAFAEGALKLPNDLTVSSQIAQSNYNPDNAPDEVVRGLDWRLNSELKKERYRLGFDYELVGDRYVSFGNPLSYQDFSGWNLYGDYKITDNWQVYSSLNQYSNNVADDPNKATQDNIGFSLSSYHRLINDQGLNLTYTHFNSETSSNIDPDTTNITDLYRFDYSLPFLFSTRALAGYQIFNSKFSNSDTPNFTQYTPNLSLFKNFGRGSTWSLSQHFSRTNNKGGPDTDDYNTSFNLNYVLSDLANLYFNTNYSRNKAGTAKPANTASFSLGYNYKILPDTVLSSEYNISSYNLNTENGRWPRNWSILGRISQSFDFSTPVNFGKVEGVVFNDTNGNFKFDKTEAGIEGVRLYLDDRREVFSDKAGSFKFSYLTPERQKIYLDLGSLPAELTAKEIAQEAEVKPRKKVHLNFALVKSSSIQGKVFVDENSDALYQLNEEPLENIAVILLPEEQFRRTDSEGDFRFDSLLPGNYTLRLNLKDIPLGYELVSSQELEIDLGIDKKIEALNFILRLEPTQIKKF